MSDTGIGVQRVGGGNVRVTIYVNGKRASITLTAERARRLSAELITSSISPSNTGIDALDEMLRKRT